MGPYNFRTFLHREQALQASLDHPNLVKLLAYSDANADTKMHFLVFDYCNNGEFGIPENKPETSLEFVDCFAQLALGNFGFVRVC